MPVNDNVKALKTVITAAMQHTNADSTDAAFAFAQMLGMLAAKLDQHEGFVPFEERWQLITEVARETYQNVKLDVRQPTLITRL